MSGPTDAIKVSQDGVPTAKETNLVRILFFLPISPNDRGLFSSMLDLMATTGAEQVVCSPSCRRYVVRTDTRAMEQEQGVLVSVVLLDTRESELAVKGWAIRTAKQIGINALQLIAYEVWTIDAPAANSDDAFQLGFEW